MSAVPKIFLTSALDCFGIFLRGADSRRARRTTPVSAKDGVDLNHTFGGRWVAWYAQHKVHFTKFGRRTMQYHTPQPHRCEASVQI